MQDKKTIFNAFKWKYKWDYGQERNIDKYGKVKVYFDKKENINNKDTDEYERPIIKKIKLRPELQNKYSRIFFFALNRFITVYEIIDQKIMHKKDGTKYKEESWGSKVGKFLNDMYNEEILTIKREKGRNSYKANPEFIQGLIRCYTFSEPEKTIIEKLYLNPSNTPDGTDIGDSETLVTCFDVWSRMIKELLNKNKDITFLDFFLFPARKEHSSIIAMHLCGNRLQASMLTLNEFNEINWFSNSLPLFLMYQLSNRFYTDMYLEKENLFPLKFEEIKKHFINKQILIHIFIYNKLKSKNVFKNFTGKFLDTNIIDGMGEIEIDFIDEDLTKIWKKIVSFISISKRHFIKDIYGKNWKHDFSESFVEYLSEIIENSFVLGPSDDPIYDDKLTLIELPYKLQIKKDDKMTNRLYELKTFLEKNTKL